MKINSLKGLDKREFAILSCIFQFQVEDQKGVRWGKLLDLKQITSIMSRQTFSRRLKGLIKRGLVEKEKIKDKRGKPTFYRLDSKLFTELKEYRDRYLTWDLESDIRNFEKDIESFTTQQYVDAMMELAFGLLNLLIILLAATKTEAARWMLYESTYSNIELLFRNILKRASKSQEDKKQALTKLFEILEQFSNRPIGKRFELNEIYNLRTEIIRLS